MNTAKRVLASGRMLFVISFVLTVAVRAIATGTTPTVQVDTSSLPLVQANDLVYIGAFRLPGGPTERESFAYAGGPIAYLPDRKSLLIVGNQIHQLVGEVSIPTPGLGESLDSLPRATMIRNPTDILTGKLLTVDGATGSGVNIGGILPFGSSLIVSAWDYYDTHVPSQTLTHFVAGQNFSSLPPAQGPYQLGTGYTIDGTPYIGGFVSGYMAPVPAEWQSLLGGPALAGQSGNIPIISRTSSGPAASVFNPANLGQTNPAPATPVLGYPGGHQTLGVWGEPGGLFDGSQSFRGVIFPPGTRSVLFIGWGGKFCYGMGTADPDLAGKPTPGATDPSEVYCFDPTEGSGTNKGVHTYPTKPLVWAYDANDLVAVKRGTKKPWDLRPYATWNLSLPFQSKIVNGLEAGHFAISGATYDPETRRIYLISPEAEGVTPIVFVLSLGGLIPDSSGLCRW